MRSQITDNFNVHAKLCILSCVSSQLAALTQTSCLYISTEGILSIYTKKLHRTVGTGQLSLLYFNYKVMEVCAYKSLLLQYKAAV